MTTKPLHWVTWCGERFVAKGYIREHGPWEVELYPAHMYVKGRDPLAVVMGDVIWQDGFQVGNRYEIGVGMAINEEHIRNSVKYHREEG